MIKDLNYEKEPSALLKALLPAYSLKQCRKLLCQYKTIPKVLSMLESEEMQRVVDADTARRAKEYAALAKRTAKKSKPFFNE